ncbi:MAG: hypothetical protein ACQKBY_00225, partial [Verrucomicrobiales bacterium]
MKLLVWSIVRVIVVFALVAGLVSLVGRVVTFASLWPWWAVPLLVALAGELILWLYRYEKQVVSAKRGRWLTGLRLAGLAFLCWILLEPVWSRYEERELEKEVIVLVDDSASMHLVDDGEEKSRQELAREALEASGLLAELEGKVGVRELKVARRALGEGESAADGWDQA